MKVHHKIWQQVFERDNGICQYCDVDLLGSFAAYWSATVDHVTGVCVGGTDDPCNLKLCCTGCNGLLSRSGGLTTWDARRAYVQKRIAEEHDGYVQWQRHLGRAVS